MVKFKLETKYQPAGDQPQAIGKLISSLEAGYKHQTLLGVTGSGKTFTMANVVNKIQKPTLVMCHNKTLAAQLASEFQEFFPDNAIHYFVSYYDYYQPEAYIPRSDTYIEKDTQINEEIDRLRNAATTSLMSRSDVLIVASVSCIYGLGNPADYLDLSLELHTKKSYKRDKLLRRLTDLQYSRNDYDLKRGTYRAQGDTLEIVLASEDTVITLRFFGDELEQIQRRHMISGETLEEMSKVKIFPAKHFVTTEEKMQIALDKIRDELKEQLKKLKKEGKVLEAARLEQRTNFDLEMMSNTGFVAGIENYSRHMDGRSADEPPSTLIDYFPDDFLLFIDESHQTIPQIGAMYKGDRSRKETLVNYGFRLPSALDNRPLKFDEFEQKITQAVYVSATPGPYELQKSLVENEFITKTKKAMPSPEELRNITTVEQINRPTGLLDPMIEIQPIENQVDHLLQQIKIRVAKNERVLVTTLSKRMAEELTAYIVEAGIKAQYLHSEVETFDRLETLRDLRLGVYDVIVGINLLREGLDLPEVSLVAILDADKEGFLRSETAFMQIMGRAARHLNGQVIMYADRITGSMQRAIDETLRRRKIQEDYNSKHGITPESIIKKIAESRLAGKKEQLATIDKVNIDPGKLSKDEMKLFIDELNEQMELASLNLEFELAAEIRDKITELKQLQKMKNVK
ncbi:TPA: excinuclease ABC subunit UvrB [Patescibacteria group bacterium]|nr:excinuclease ABC subunit UvrB [Patescibacteria group bacterium]